MQYQQKKNAKPDYANSYLCLNLILNAYLLYVYASANKQKQLWEFH